MLDRRPEIVLEGELLVTPFRADLADGGHLGVVDVRVGEHHEREQFERGLVLLVGGGVDGDAAIEVGQAVIHRILHS